MIIPKKPLIYLAVLIAFIALVYFWRAEIYKAAESLATGQINEETITVSEQSNKEAENVRKEVQSFDDIQLDTRLCDLGIVQDNGCKNN